MIPDPDLDPDRRLALAYVPAAVRPAMEALWRLDVTLGAVLAGGREPMIGRIRLAWWREALEALDRGPPPPAPLLRALAAHVLPAVRGAELAAMEAGWAELLADGTLTERGLKDYAEARGGALFRHSARLLGLPDHPVGPAGARWALVDVARRSADPDEASTAFALAAAIDTETSWPRQLRPLGMLSVLNRRDLAGGAGTWEKQGSPARMLVMARHRLTGR